jgi:acyl-CoA synthetase (AMP-forming)/AMP-acid ligase II
MSSLPELTHSTLPQIVQRAVDRYGDRIALEDGDRQWTFKQLQAQARKVSRALIASGIEKGDKVAIWCPNIAEWVFAAVGLQSVGAVLVPLPNRFSGAEAADILARAGVRLLFGYPQMEQGELPDILADKALPALETIVLLRGAASGALSFDEFLARADAVSDEEAAERAAAIDADDVMDMLFTSGTTGKPKGVLCSHGQNIRVFEAWSDTVGLRADDIYLGVNPFFHSFGYKAGWFSGLLTGCKMVPVFAFDKDGVLSMIQDKGITMWPGAPSLYEMILAHPARADYDLSSLRLGVTGAAPVSVALVEAMKNELGFETVVTAYGLTECCGVVSICRPEDDAEIISATSGRAIDGVEVQLVDPGSKQVMGAGEQGEIWVRGYNVMAGYFDMPEATSETITAEGWLRTGDLGVMDERGYLRITGRLKDMYIMNGENVYPAEVENTLASLDGVAQVAVIGVPKKPQGEVGVAYVVTKAGAALDNETVKAHCKTQLASYKVPYYVEFVQALPLNGTGKVDKLKLQSDWTSPSLTA